jgi:hypothetical protein
MLKRKARWKKAAGLDIPDFLDRTKNGIGAQALAPPAP